MNNVRIHNLFLLGRGWRRRWEVGQRWRDPLYLYVVLTVTLTRFEFKMTFVANGRNCIKSFILLIAVNVMIILDLYFSAVRVVMHIM